MKQFMYEGTLGTFPISVTDENQAKQLTTVISRRISSIIIHITIKGQIVPISSDDLHIIN